MNTRPKFYVASKPWHADSWREFAVENNDRIEVVSTWIDNPGENAFGPNVADHLAARCLGDILICDTLVLYEDPMSRDAKYWTGALIEVGAALALGKQVVAVVNEDTRNRLDIWARHPNFRYAYSIEEAFNLKGNDEP